MFREIPQVRKCIRKIFGLGWAERKLCPFHLRRLSCPQCSSSIAVLRLEEEKKAGLTATSRAVSLCCGVICYFHQPALTAGGNNSVFSLLQGTRFFLMATFVNEHVNTLNKALSDAFQPHIEALPEERNAASEPESALQRNDKQRFLSLAAQRIDLASHTSLPSLHQVKTSLEQYIQNNEFDSQSLEFLLVAKSAVAIYGSLLDTILNSTLPISQSLNYWNSIYGSRLNEGYYALQSTCGTNG